MALVAGLVLVAGCSDRTVASSDGETGGGSTATSDDGGGDDGDGGDGGGDDGTTTGPDGGSTETTTDHGDTTSDGWTTGDDGCMFYGACPDVGGDTFCDVWAQDCPGGAKCMPWANDGGNSWNATKCTPIDPDPKQPGEACHVEGSPTSGVDDCAHGSMCFNVDPGTLEGYCVAFCEGSPGNPLCSDVNTYCTIDASGFLPLCVAGCDPIVHDCPENTVCVLTPEGGAFYCVLDGSGEDGQYGDPCEYVNACDPGVFCAMAELVPGCAGLVGCCTEYCDLTAQDPLTFCSGVADGVACVPFFEQGQAPPGLEHVGACTLPP